MLMEELLPLSTSIANRRCDSTLDCWFVGYDAASGDEAERGILWIRIYVCRNAHFAPLAVISQVSRWPAVSVCIVDAVDKHYCTSGLLERSRSADLHTRDGLSVFIAVSHNQ